MNQFWLSLAFLICPRPGFPLLQPSIASFEAKSSQLFSLHVSEINGIQNHPPFFPQKCGEIEYRFLLKDGPFLYASVGFVGCKALAQGRPWFKHFTRCQLWVSCSFLVNACDGQLQVWCTHRDVSTTGGMKHSKTVELLNCQTSWYPKWWKWVVRVLAKCSWGLTVDAGYLASFENLAASSPGQSHRHGVEATSLWIQLNLEVMTFPRFPPIGHVGIPQNQSWIGAGASLLVLSILLRHCLQFIELGLNSLLSLWGSSEMTRAIGEKLPLALSMGV